MKPMHLTLATATIAAAALGSQVVQAGQVTLDFESVTGFASINQFYAGGTDSAGAAGTNLGVSFGGDALGLVNDALGTYFENAPSPLGVMAPVGAAATLNAAFGFSGISFYYGSTAAVTAGVQVWSGLDGTGSLLASLDLLNNGQVGVCAANLCNFELLSVSTLPQLGRSVTFGNAASLAAFDNVSLVPEPSTLALLAGALAALAWRTRRRA
jgi:PEP-CTERM motif